MPTYRDIENELKKVLLDNGFKNDFDSRIYYRSLSDEIDVEFIFPEKNEELFVKLSTHQKEEKYPLCYLAYHAGKTDYLNKVIRFLIEKTEKNVEGDLYFLQSDTK